MVAGDPGREERTPQSILSPGVVADAEELARIIISPEHIGLDGRLKPAAFQMQDIMQRGVSLNRLAYIDASALRRQAEAMAKRGAGRSPAGIGRALCCALRDLRDEDGQRALCVLDTAEAFNSAHASAIAADPRSRSRLKGVRGRLVELFEPVRPFPSI